jgi:predicted dehydrogenase
VLIPSFKKAGAILNTIATSGGTNGVYHGKKAGFELASTDLNAIWGNPAIDAVVIATRHNQHAQQVTKALKMGKHVFVEKPLAITLGELDEIESAASLAKTVDGHALHLMVGFNRRFSPLAVRMKELLDRTREPKVIVVTVNAGSIPVDHWTQDLEVGGGRIVGEGCHFVDLMRFLVGNSIVGHHETMVGASSSAQVRNDKVGMMLNFADGSMGTIHYLANGGNVFPKERVEVFCGDAVLQLDNFRSLRGYGWPGFRNRKLWRQNKGQEACVESFLTAIRTGDEQAIPIEEIFEVSRISIEISESLNLGGVGYRDLVEVVDR